MRIPQKPPDFQPELPELIRTHLEVLSQTGLTLSDGRYLHWNELRRREPPAGLSAQQWWAVLKFARYNARTIVRPMTDAYGATFSFTQPPAVSQALHDFDRKNVAKELLAALGNQDAVTEYRVQQLIEEAISSSVIEGARPTTRDLARQMVREGRPPASLHDRMILNNWRAMQRILALRKEARPLVVDDVLELHRILGEDALEVPDAAGKLRGPEHRVRVEDDEGNVWHIAPPAEGLRDRLAEILRFAEADGQSDPHAFIHPVLRAIIVHFWIGYEHPFRDGNGRIARALYYWCMLRHGYEMAEFLSISGPIDRSKSDYYLAYAHVETDDNDLTYFILHQLDVMRQALAELKRHLDRRVERVQALARVISGFDEINHRQRALLQHAIRHPLESYTIDGHALSHHVSYQTARTDLLDLVKRAYLKARRTGKSKRFHPADALIKANQEDTRHKGDGPKH